MMGGKKPIIPLSIDFSTLPDGALPSTLTGSTWAIVSGKAYNTPTEGDELLTDGGLETWASATNLTSWTETLQDAETSINQETTTVQAGSNSCRVDVGANAKYGQISQVPTLAVGEWANLSCYARKSAGGGTVGLRAENQRNAAPSPLALTTTEWSFQICSFLKNTAAGFLVGTRTGGGASTSLYQDTFSCKKITTSTLFAWLDAKRADVTTKAGWTTTNGTISGVVMNMDSAINPQNYVILAQNGLSSNLYLWKMVAGTITQVTSGTITYGAGRTIELRKSGTTYQMFYNGSQVGTDQTISDASIISNTIHGAISTYGGNSLDTFFVG